MTRSKFIIDATSSAILVIGSNIKHTSAQLKRDKISFTEAFSGDNIYDSNNPQLTELNSVLFSISKETKRDRIRGNNIRALTLVTISPGKCFLFRGRE
ncbi:MAG: hypothetical protein IH825_05105 [Candidatus Marinimicrobia bacterium]|nr:hypothetical protein [Candidatus Neomarinimicrobiota bacterium]